MEQVAGSLPVRVLDAVTRAQMGALVVGQKYQGYLLHLLGSL